MSNELLTLSWGVCLPAGPKVLLIAIADKANEDGQCWPSRDTLARMTGLAPSTVSEHLKTLVDEKYVEQLRRRHENALYTVNRNRLVESLDRRISEVSNPDLQIPEVQNSDLQIPEDPDNPAETSEIQRSLPYTNPQEPSSAKAPNAAKTNAPKRRKSKRADEYTDAFETWWALYPRKKDKFAAFKAFRIALKLTTLEVLIEAVRRFAVEMNGRSDEHIKLGSTWLTKRCWESDDAVPVVRTEAEATEWLREQWRAADVAAVEAVAGLAYETPDLPLDVEGRTQVDVFFREHRQQWITANHNAIITRLTRGIA